MGLIELSKKIDLLPDIYDKSVVPKSNIRKIFEVIEDEFQECLDDLKLIRDIKLLANCYGKTLDLFGEQYRLKRFGKSDFEYRAFILAKIFERISGNGIDKILTYFSFFISSGPIRLIELWDPEYADEEIEGMQIWRAFSVEVGTISDELMDILNVALQKLKAAGIYAGINVRSRATKWPDNFEVVEISPRTFDAMWHLVYAAGHFVGFTVHTSGPGLSRIAMVKSVTGAPGTWVTSSPFPSDSMTSEALFSVATNGTTIVLMNTVGEYFAWSDDAGTTWTKVNFTATYNTQPRVIWTGTHFVALIEAVQLYPSLVGVGTMGISTDGKSWSYKSLPTDGEWKDIAFGNGMLILLGSTSRPGGYESSEFVKISEDLGDTWGDIFVNTPGPPWVNFRDAIIQNDVIVVMGQTRNFVGGSPTQIERLFVSQDRGATFADVTDTSNFYTPGSIQRLIWSYYPPSMLFGKMTLFGQEDIDFGGGVIEHRGFLSQSTDGINWERIQVVVGYHYNGVSFSPLVPPAVSGANILRSAVASNGRFIIWGASPSGLLPGDKADGMFLRTEVYRLPR